MKKKKNGKVEAEINSKALFRGYSRQNFIGLIQDFSLDFQFIYSTNIVRLKEYQ